MWCLHALIELTSDSCLFPACPVSCRQLPFRDDKKYDPFSLRVFAVAMDDGSHIDLTRFRLQGNFL